jgi:GTP-binding protein Era
VERPSDGIVHVAATIHVERDSHKGIVIGKGGQRLKQIGIESRQAIEALLGTQVHLELFVRVEPKWTETADGLRKLGYQ